MEMNEREDEYRLKSLELLHRYHDKSDEQYLNQYRQCVEDMCIAQFQIAIDYEDCREITSERVRTISNESLEEELINHYWGTYYGDKYVSDSASFYFEKALSIAKEARDTIGVIDILHHIGVLNQNDGNELSAIKYYEMAYDLALMTGHEIFCISPCVNLAEILIYSGQPEKADKYLNLATSGAKKCNALTTLSYIYNVRSNEQLLMGNYKLAVDYMNMSIKSANEANSSAYNYIVEREVSDLLAYEEMTDKLREQSASRRARLLTIAGCFLAVFFLIVIAIIHITQTKKRNLAMSINRMHSSFLASIAENFRTPITVILGMGNDIMEGRTSPDNIKSIGQAIVYHGEELAYQLSGLMDVGSVNPLITEPRWIRGDIISFIDLQLEPIRYESHKKQISLFYRHDDDALITDFDPDFLQRIVNNLGLFAVDSEPENGQVVASISAKTNRLVMTLAIPDFVLSEEENRRAFEPFFLERKHSNRRGTNGMALAIAKNVIMAFGGSIVLDSNAESGTIFTITLPIRQYKNAKVIQGSFANSRRLTSKTSSFLDLIPKGQDGNQPLILIVEDNPSVAYVTGSMLASDFRLLYADNGKLGLEKANKSVPDLVITDIDVEGLDGLSLAMALRNNVQTSHVPIIAISSNVDEKERLEALRSGVDAYINKPFTRDNLMGRVTNLLNQRKKLMDIFANTLKGVQEQEYDKEDLMFLTRVSEYMVKAMKENLPTDVESVSSAMCLSTRQFSRKLQSLTNDVPTMYLNRVKIERAKHLLKTHPEKSINDIALECAYEDASYF